MQAAHLCNQQPGQLPVLKDGMSLMGDRGQQVGAAGVRDASMAQGMATVVEAAGVHSRFLNVGL